MNMVILWAVVIAVALILEFITYVFISAWFVVGGVVALILAATGVSFDLQVIIFIAVSFVLLASLRPIVKTLLRVRTVATNADSNIGKVFRLESDVVEGKGTIKINDTIWTAVSEKRLKAGAKVVVTGISGNKYIVSKSEE